MSNLAENILSRLETLRMTPTRASKEAGLGESAIRDIITGKSKSPSINTLQALSQVLECKLSDLLDGFAPEQTTYQLGRFWMVHGMGQGVPRYIHGSEESARQEARRLASVYPEITFVVLESTTAYRSETPKINQFEIVASGGADDSDIPF